MPEGIETIEAGAFALCVDLKTITLPRTIRSIQRHAFLGTYSLSTVVFQGTKNECQQIKFMQAHYWAPDVEVICTDGILD